MNRLAVKVGLPVLYVVLGAGLGVVGVGITIQETIKRFMEHNDEL